MKNRTIDFVSCHRPALQTGKYKVEVQHEINHQKINQQKLTFAKTFYIAGERFNLNPNSIGSVFPPNYSLGEHHNLLPHVVLNRSTLPWERSCNDKDDQWLLILLLTDKEMQESEGKAVKTQIKRIGDIKKSSHFKNIQLQPGQDDKNQVSIIEVQKALLQQLLPSSNDLRHLAHVRKVKSDDNSMQEQAIVLGNRITQIGENYNAYLISIENCYSGGSFNFQDAKDDDHIPLIVLKQWRFGCSKRYKITRRSLERIPSISQENKTKLETELLEKEFLTKKSFEDKLNEILPGTDADTEIFTFGKFGDILKHLNLKSIAIDSANSKIYNKTKKYFDSGFVPMPHFFRNGENSISWYHGPLVPFENKKTFKEYLTESFGNTSLEIKSPDQLMRYYVKDAMFDVSYSAAWELGRLLFLKNKRVSGELYQWRRNSVQQIRCKKQYPQHSHILGYEYSNRNTELPEIVTNWFADLQLLKCLPFNYLVPDQKMLPVESINFFWVDNLWIDCIIDGALSVGRVNGSNEQDISNKISYNRKNIITGCLLRSEAVSGWPDLIVDAYSKDKKSLGCLGMEKLSDSVLMCMFDGKVQDIEIHLKPEALHSEFVEIQGKYFAKNKLNKEVILRSKNKQVVNFEKSFLKNSSSETALDLLTSTAKYKFSLED